MSHSPCCDNAQRDDEDFVGAEEFSALHHPGYEWVEPRVKSLCLGLVSLQP